MTEWHIVTGEYPPQPGGVSDYTQLVARGLAAAGDHVTIWAPPIPVGAGDSSAAGREDARDAGITLCRLPDRFGRRSLGEMSAHLDRESAPRRILVQYVPHAFGWKALNVPFCWWLRSRRAESIWVMFHEVAFPIDRGQSVAQNAMGVVTRRMASIVAGAAERAFVSIPAWEPVLRELSSSPLPIEWLPVPSAIPVVDDPDATAAVRARFAGDGQPIIGHFGTYGALTRPLVEAVLPLLLAASDCCVMFLGRGSDAAAEAFERTVPSARGRVRGAGALTPSGLSAHLAACDVMLQPYPDGISSRRTSAMAGLAHGRVTATTHGALTEPIWRDSPGVVLSPAGDAHALAAIAADLAGDRARASRLGRDAKALYNLRFDLRHTIAGLMRPPAYNARGAA
jgi:glycosyltransferase involved in cell wall biosynthesis